MHTATIIAIAVALIVLALIGIYLSHMAGRLDRAHLKVESTRSSLLANLAYRSSVALDLAGDGVLEPDVAVNLRMAARQARDEEVSESGWHQESVLTAALHAAFADPEVTRNIVAADAVRVAELESVCRRVEYSRRFHNDAVRTARHLRDRFIPRMFRLAGHADWPEYADFDDSVPEGLGVR